MSVTRPVRTASALALAVAGLAVPVTAASVLTAGPAAATTCGGGPGVTVVVDRTALGGATITGCDGDGGTATDNFSDTGPAAALKYAQRDPGFVCRVGGLPTDDPCTNTSPADAYWGLWWSDGKSGNWQYSTVGVRSLTVPAGGSVAFRFNTGDRTPPSVDPPIRTVSGGSGDSGSAGGTGGAGSGGGATPPSPAPSTAAATPSPSASATTAPPAPSASPESGDDQDGERRESAGDADRADRKSSSDRAGQEDRKDARDRRDATATPTAEPETEQETTLVDDPVDPQASQSAAADGLPVWVAPALLTGLLLVGGAVVGLRRLRGAPSRS